MFIRKIFYDNIDITRFGLFSKIDRRPESVVMHNVYNDPFQSGANYRSFPVSGEAVINHFLSLDIQWIKQNESL